MQVHKLLLVAIVATLCNVTFAQTRAARLAAQEKTQQAQQPVAAQPAAPAASTGPNAITTALQKAGVQRCAGQIQKVTDFLTRGARMGVAVFPSATNPDDSLVSISAEIQAGNVLTYASANFAPRTDGCSAEYEQVTHWQNTCEQVHAAQYANFKPMGELQAQIKVYYNNASTRIMLVPSGASCVAIKKEVLH